jgi:DNA modification methylase
MEIRTNIQIEKCPIGRLIPRIMNPRTHDPKQIAQVVASMKEFGWTNPILIGADNDILAGHARVAAARQLGMTEVPIIQLKYLSEAQRRALVVSDNAIALNAGWSEETLRLELQALQEADYDLSLVGFDDDELARLLAAEDATTGLTDEDAVPELPEAPTSVAGDRWRLGPHVLLVGDATNKADVARLMNSDTADMVFIDPPYNCSYEGYTEEHLTIQNDRMSGAEFKQFLEAAFHSCRAVIKPGASLYVCHSSSWQREFQNALEVAGFEVRCQIIWAKNTFAWGFGRYKFQHEPIFYAHVAGQSDVWYGDRSQSTLWQENKPAANRLHPTMKPTELIERALVNSSKTGDLVADIFGGSGSTLIACERRGRASRLMEVDPRYADVICRRYQEYTGGRAVLDDDGRSFDEIAMERCDPQIIPGGSR